MMGICSRVIKVTRENCVNSKREENLVRFVYTFMNWIIHNHYHISSNVTCNATVLIMHFALC